MGTAKINQKEYLKKYLGHDNDEKKKKKKKYKIGPKKVKIIDDDVDLKNLRPLEDGEFDIFNSTEDAPQIAGIIDERGPINFGDKRRWKIIADDGEGNVAISSSNDQRNPEEISRNKKQYNRINDDFSPPRKLIKDSKHNHHDSNEKNSDVSQRDREKLSLKKENKHHELSNDDLSPSRVSIRDSKQKPKNFHRDSDIPRQDQRRSSSKRDRKSYVQSDDDLSPPRSQFEHSGRKFHNSNRHCDELQSDRRKLSSHRKERNHSYSDVHLSPLQGQSRNSNGRYHDSNRNFDDSRRNRERSSSKRVDKKQTYNDDDLSPPRVRDRDQEAKYHDSDRNSHHSRSNKLKSSSKKRRNDSLNDDDMSPPRLSMKSTELTHRDSYKGSNSLRNYQDKTSRNRKSRWTDESQHSQSPPIDKRMKKTLDGKAAGLQDAATLREEIAAYKKREDKFFSEMSAEISGVGQAAVLRDRKTGKKRNLEAEAAHKHEEEKLQNEIDAKYAKWGKGLKQVDDQTEKLKQDLYEMSKPLARYADDADLDAQLRAADREGDPMREYLKQKRIKEGKQEPDRPSYQGSYMPNRFGIKPGHRWDGVDRSNGYEKKWFEARNARIAVQEEAYKWSTADM